MKLHHKHEAHLVSIFLFSKIYAVPFSHSHTNTQAHTYYLHSIRSAHFCWRYYTLLLTTYNHLLCNCANIPIITPHTHTHTQTHMHYMVKDSLSQTEFCKYDENFYKFETSSLWHINAPK